MFSSKLFVFCALVISVNCLPANLYQPAHLRGYIYDSSNILQDDFEDFGAEDAIELSRPRRQLGGSMSTNPDGSANLNAKLPLAGNDHNLLSAIGSVNGFKNGGQYGAAGGGLMFENKNGHSLTGVARHIPGFGDQLTGAGKVNLLHTDNHKLDANAFITRNMPSIPNVPNFNTHGGSVDYTFKDKVGASLGMSQTDFLKRTDYSAMGNYNLFRNRDSSLDLNAGFSKSVSPFIPKSNWQPSGGLSFTKYW